MRCILSFVQLIQNLFGFTQELQTLTVVICKPHRPYSKGRKTVKEISWLAINTMVIPLKPKNYINWIWSQIRISTYLYFIYSWDIWSLVTCVESFRQLTALREKQPFLLELANKYPHHWSLMLHENRGNTRKKIHVKWFRFFETECQICGNWPTTRSMETNAMTWSTHFRFVKLNKWNQEHMHTCTVNACILTS